MSRCGFASLLLLCSNMTPLYLRSFIQLYCGKRIFIHFSNIPLIILLLFSYFFLCISMSLSLLTASERVVQFGFTADSFVLCLIDVLYYLFQTYYLVHIFPLRSFFFSYHVLVLLWIARMFPHLLR